MSGRADGRRQHARDYCLHSVLDDWLIDHGGIAAKTVLPKSVRQHHTRRRRFTVRQQPTNEGLEAKHREQIRRDPVHARRFRFAFERQDSIPLLKRRDALERRALPLPIEHVQS